MAFTSQPPQTTQPPDLKIFGKGWVPEFDTMDTFVCSSFYYLMYLQSEGHGIHFATSANHATSRSEDFRQRLGSGVRHDGYVRLLKFLLSDVSTVRRSWHSLRNLRKPRNLQI